MRSFLFALVPLIAGCAAMAPAPPSPAPVVACTAEAVVEAGQRGTLLPSTCQPADAAIRERYAIGKRLARIEEELSEINYLIASRDGSRLFGGAARIGRGGFGSGAYLIDRRVELKNARRVLRRRAGISS